MTYITIQEVSANVGMNPKTIRRYVQQGKFPEHQKEKDQRKYWLLGDIERWTKDREAMRRASMPNMQCAWHEITGDLSMPHRVRGVWIASIDLHNALKGWQYAMQTMDDFMEWKNDMCMEAV